MALSGSAAMSDLSPECAPKRTFGICGFAICGFAICGFAPEWRRSPSRHFRSPSGDVFNQPDGQISFFCQAPNFLLPSWGKSVAFLRPSHPTRGAARDRHETRGGMRWTRKLRLTSAADADGEDVWS